MKEMGIFWEGKVGKGKIRARGSNCAKSATWSRNLVHDTKRKRKNIG